MVRFNRIPTQWFISVRELEAAFEEERDVCKAEKTRVVGLEESLANERKKMQEEIDEKLKIITDLSKQLEVHQKNFEALKHELSQVINLGHWSRPSLQIVIRKLKKEFESAWSGRGQDISYSLRFRYAYSSWMKRTLEKKIRKKALAQMFRDTNGRRKLKILILGALFCTVWFKTLKWRPYSRFIDVIACQISFIVLLVTIRILKPSLTIFLTTDLCLNSTWLCGKSSQGALNFKALKFQKHFFSCHHRNDGVYIFFSFTCWHLMKILSIVITVSL